MRGFRRSGPTCGRSSASAGIDADSGAESEAVHDSSRRIRHTYAHAVDVAFLDAASEPRAGDPHDPNGREVYARNAGAPVDGDADRARVQRAEAAREMFERRRANVDDDRRCDEGRP
jgi:hypothetical protein